MTSRDFDVIVVGGGILGLSCGHALAGRGLRCVVLEKGEVAWEASGRATGFQSLRGENSPEIPLAAEANRLWMTLEEELGYPTEWLAGGRLWVALGEEEHDALATTCRHWQASGLPVELLEGAAARRRVPALSSRTIGAMYTTRGGHANPQRTAQAYAWAFLDRAGEIRDHCPVLEILATGGRIRGVRTADGNLSAPWVVCCAGPQAMLLCRSLGVELPLAIARLEACISAPLPPLFDVAIVGNGLSVRQTRRGNLHFNGGPHEWVEVDLCSEPVKPNTPNLRGAARRLVELFPDLGMTPLLRTWAGIVEVTPDHATIIENVSEPEGLIVVSASGHGFGLAPAIGKVVGEIATVGRSSIPVEGLGLSRFRDLSPDWRESRKWTAGNYNT